VRLPIALAPLLAGCSTLDLELGARIDLDRCADLQAAEADRAAVLEALGPPSQISPHADGVAFLYEHLVLTERQLGFNLQRIGLYLGMPALSFLKVSLGRSSCRREAALFLFDDAGRLTDSVTADWVEEYGRGGSLQIFFAVQQVVDSDLLTASPRGLDWGLELLDPLPQELNVPHRADLELRGSPFHAGQQTLELRREETGRR